MSRDMSTGARGYGHRHQSLRKQWRRLVDMGAVVCARCGFPIVPGEPWDLGHDDHDRSVIRVRSTVRAIGQQPADVRGGWCLAGG